MTRLQRLFRIAWVFFRYRLDTFLPLAELPAPLKLFFLLAPWHLFPQPKLSRGDRLRLAAWRLQRALRERVRPLVRRDA